jgi:hypothetical protein
MLEKLVTTIKSFTLFNNCFASHWDVLYTYDEKSTAWIDIKIKFVKTSGFGLRMNTNAYWKRGSSSCLCQTGVVIILEGEMVGECKLRGGSRDACVFALGNARTQQQRSCHDTWRVQLLLWTDWVSTYSATSRNNRKGFQSGVLCGSAPRLYDPTDRVQFREWVQCSYGVLTSGQRKLKNLHSLPGNV